MRIANRKPPPVPFKAIAFGSVFRMSRFDTDTRYLKTQDKVHSGYRVVNLETGEICWELGDTMVVPVNGYFQEE